jgi:hypothetical protein
MRNAIIFGIMLLVLAVSAIATPVELTEIKGTVYDSSHNKVTGASVTVVCYNGTTINTLSNTSNGGGEYKIDSFLRTNCNTGYTLNITATKGAESGFAQYTVACNGNGKCSQTNKDVTFNSPAVPEFGVVAAAIALIGSVALFLVKRN